MNALELPLLAEALIWAIAAYLAGLLIAWARWGRERNHY